MDLQRLTGVAAVTTVMGLSVAVSTASAPSATLDVVHVRSFGGGPLPGLFKQPDGIAVHPDGRIFVADSMYCRVQVFDARGNFLAMWGTCGSAPGQFRHVSGIAFDRSGLAYVVDSWNARIQVFTSDGTFVRAWGSQGGGVGQFQRPAGIAVDREDRVFVADTYNYRVQVFTTAGEFVRAWGSKGGGNGQFQNPKAFPGGDGAGPVGVAVGGDGLVYVTDPWNSRVQVFTPAGEFVYCWRAGNTPTGIAIDSRDVVMVTNAGWASSLNVTGMRKFTSAGALLRRWYGDGFGPGQFDHTSAVAMDASGNVYVADTDNNRVQKFNADGAYVTQWGSNGDGLLRGPTDVTVDRNGGVYIADSLNGRIQKFSADGAFVAKFGEKRRAFADGTLTYPIGVAVDSEGLVYVTDILTDRIQVFSANGAFLRAWAPAERSPRNAILRRVTVGPTKELLRIQDHQLIKFDADGRRLAVYKGTRGAFLNDFALDSRGNIYLAEAQEDGKWSRIRVLSPVGKEIATWPSMMRADGKYGGILHIAIDLQDRVYLVESWNCEVRAFDNRGVFLGRWGSCGFADGQFDEPSSIAVDERGKVYVADYGNNRVQVFQIR